MNTVPRPQGAPTRPSVQLLQDVFDLLDAHGYQRAPGRTLSASLSQIDQLLAGLAAVYEGQEVPGA